MAFFEDERFYKTDDPALRIIGTASRMHQWRGEGVGPPFYRFAKNVRYLGSDLNAWMAKRRVEPDKAA